MKKPVLKFITKQPFNRLFPSCPMSCAICQIAGRKTLTKDELTILSDNGGFDVEVE